MSATTSRGATLGAIAIALVVVLLGAQALAIYSAPPEPVAPTGAMLGHTGFEYLGGVRKFVAATLWNRLEPQFHQYGDGRPIDQRLEFLPTMRLVQTLDPQFEQAYYNAAFLLARLGKYDQALGIAREGIANNPDSGLLLANYAQILMMQDPEKNLPEMVKQAEKGVAPTTTWANADDQFEGYGIFRAVFRLAGDTAAAEMMTEAQKRLAEQGAKLGAERD